MGVHHRGAQRHQRDNALQHLRNRDSRPLRGHPFGAVRRPRRQPHSNSTTDGQCQRGQNPGQQQRREHSHKENPTNPVNVALARQGQNRTSHTLRHSCSVTVHMLFGKQRTKAHHQPPKPPAGGISNNYPRPWPATAAAPAAAASGSRYVPPRTSGLIAESRS